MRPVSTFFLLILLSASCAVFKSGTKDPEEIQARALFASYTKAYNEHNMKDIIAHFSDDFAWISIQPKKFETILRGKAQLIESYDKYYKTYPNVRTKIVQLKYDAGYIWTDEVVTWSMGKEKFTQKILAVYYIKEGKIQRLYYFEEPEDAVAFLYE
ncbi:nuclear transport factor 2 family protein [bacterium]|nr:MAG: nuclear transport factor 2 family protein [bacterium]